MLGVKSISGLAFYDWETLDLIRRIEIQPKHVSRISFFDLGSTVKRVGINFFLSKHKNILKECFYFIDIVLDIYKQYSCF